jgi:nitrogen fixation NifU-like protein
LTTGESTPYSATTVEHFRHPRNVGRLDDCDAFGAVEDRSTANYVSFYLKLVNGRVSAARFRTLGCSACIAASSVATELVLDRSTDGVRAISASRILAALGGLPPAKEHCAELAAQALRAAIDDYERRTGAPPGAGARE